MSDEHTRSCEKRMTTSLGKKMHKNATELVAWPRLKPTAQPPRSLRLRISRLNFLGCFYHPVAQHVRSHHRCVLPHTKHPPLNLFQAAQSQPHAQHSVGHFNQLLAGV